MKPINKEKNFEARLGQASLGLHGLPSSTRASLPDHDKYVTALFETNYSS